MAVITISQQFGSNGKALGKMLADELEYVFVDRDIVSRIALAANVSEAWVEGMEKEAGGKLSWVISRIISRDMVDSVLKSDHGYLDETIYLDYLVVMIAQIAEEGNAVIMGRGSQYILRDHPDAVHILLVNDVENRIRATMARHELSYEGAARMVRDEDTRRSSLFKRIGKTNYDQAELYDLVFNMARLDLKTVKAMVLKLVERKERQPDSP